jgi:NAD-dependent SIR2 family protein deacetylase
MQPNRCNIIVYAGSGCSVPSGIPTFRGGLWNDHDVTQVCNFQTLRNGSPSDVQFINRFYAEFSRMEQNAQPHHFHLWLKSKQDLG